MAGKQLYQNDPRWKDTQIGHGGKHTIGEVGCLLTSMAMIANYFGSNETVASFNEKMKQGGGFMDQWIRPAMISAVNSEVKYVKRLECSGQKAPMGEIDAALAAGSLVVVMVDGSPRPGIQNHWVVLHRKQGDDYLMWDPWKSEGKPDTLQGRYSHAAPVDLIQDVIWYEGPAGKVTGVEEPAPKPAPAAPPTPARTRRQSATTGDESFVVHPLVDGLKMRRQPKVASGNIVKELKRSARLTPLEPVASARAKLGEHGQWIHMCDDKGNEGHVAAWYVTPVDDPALGVHKTGASDEDEDETKPVVLIVKTTTEDVAFRKRPQVSDATLIERVPYPTEFEVIESGKPEQKIAVHGEWLKVKTSDGTKGYVAAWYVVKA